MKLHANANCVVTVHGKPMAVTRGQEFDADDLVVRDFAWLFTDTPVERATAAPGERRNVRRPKK